MQGPIIGTVLLAGITPLGEPKYINGTYLVAGLDADGVPHIIQVGDDGSIVSDSSSALSVQSAVPSADVTLTIADTWFDICSFVLAAGTWLITSTIFSTVAGTAGAINRFKIYLSTAPNTPFVTAGQTGPNANMALNTSMSCIVVSTGGTYVLAAAANSVAGADALVLKEIGAYAGANGPATRMDAVKVA